MNEPILDRRTSIKSLVTLAAFGFGPGRILPSRAQSTTPSVEPPVPGLAAIAAKKGLLYGSPMNRWLTTNKRLDALYDHECSIVVNAGAHWDTLSPEPGVFDTRLTDTFGKLPLAKRKLVRNHCLVWHARTPKWFAELPTREDAARAIIDHVHQLCGYYAGQLHSWDVVNEAIKPDERQPGSLRKTVFYDKLGLDYIDIAFRAAREADPKVLLTYNDNSLDLEIPDHVNRRRALLSLVDGMKQRSVPIDAVGIQAHLDVVGMQQFSEKAFAAFLNELAQRNLKIIISEMDVNDRDAPPEVPRRDAAVADVYRRYLSVALDNRQTIALITWGMMDLESWITRGDLPAFRRTDGQRPRPLLFDDAYSPKPDYFAVVETLRAAPAR
jgi:endo-1,4-beta-xylanase